MARPFCGSLSSRNPIISQNCQTFGGGHQWTLHEEDKASKLESRFGVDLHLDRKKSFQGYRPHHLHNALIRNKGPPRLVLHLVPAVGRFNLTVTHIQAEPTSEPSAL